MGCYSNKMVCVLLSGKLWMCLREIFKLPWSYHDNEEEGRPKTMRSDMLFSRLIYQDKLFTE